MADLLLVEDDDDVAFLIAIFLEQDGHQVRRARNGERGLALLDERLPISWSWTWKCRCSTGRAWRRGCSPTTRAANASRFVLVSGVVELPSVAERVGTPYALAKPFGPTELLGIARAALRERRPPTPPR